jgi:ABC-2 type transport system permease protein
MILCAGFIAVIIVLEAGPVYSVFMAGLRGTVLSPLQWVWLLGSFSLVFLMCVLAIVVPMRWGERRLSRT